MAPAAMMERTDAVTDYEVSPGEALDVLIRAAIVLFINGQTTERTTRAVEEVAGAFGFRAAVFIRWGELRIDISNERVEQSRAVIVHPVGVHMGKVAAAMKALAAV